jgi:hypothetical protein
MTLDQSVEAFRTSTAASEPGLAGPDGAPATSPPIFVLGGPYSGKGLLGWSLAQHPAIVHITGNEWLAQFAADLQVRYEVATRQGRQFKLDPLLVDRDRFCRAFGDTINLLLLESLRAVGHATGSLARRWVDTTPGHSAAAAGLARLFPEARFVDLVGDPDSAVRGLIRVSAADGSALPAEDAYERWLEATRECLELELAFGSDRVLRIHYEELAASPQRTLERLFSFIGERFCPDSMRPLEAVPAPQPISVSLPGGPGRLSQVRREVRLLIDLLRREPPPAYSRDSEAATRVEERFLEAARTRSIERSERSFPAQVQQAVSSVVPPGRTIAVISKGDDELLAVEGRRAWHFPQTEDGAYAGYHPGSSDDAIEHLEELRGRGAAYLVIPAPSVWWLDHYTGLTRHLLAKYRLVFYELETCVIFALRADREGDQPADPFRKAIPELTTTSSPGAPSP